MRKPFLPRVFAGLCLLLAMSAALGGCSRVNYRVGSARMLCVLAGDAENRRWPPDSDVKGTDIGVSFPGPFGAEFFLFGDTTDQPFGQSGSIPGADSVAFSTNVASGNCPYLSFFQSGERLASPQIAGLGEGKPPSNFPGLFEGPSGGFYSSGRPYVAYATRALLDSDGQLRAHANVLTSGATGFQDPSGAITLNPLLNFPSDKFVEVYPIRMDAQSKPVSDPGAREAAIYFYGTSPYRLSTEVYLAKVDVADLQSLDQLQDWGARLRYYTGTGWSTDEREALSILSPASRPCMGEFSVSFNAPLGKWLMLYNCVVAGSSPRGIMFRVADQPTGPFGPENVLFNPDADHGYCNFMHRNDHGCDFGAPTEVTPSRAQVCIPPLCYRECVDGVSQPSYCLACPHGPPNPCDSLGDPNNPPSRYGGEYGPYVVDALTSNNGGGSATIRFAMSTWNPYQVVLMEATLDTSYW